ncbi:MULTISPECIES: ATP-grasp ribosomal peptide maturase [unclassified Streptomyces]|uniref:ATP-grasp ribosomal peptide maturase n=1 Tax=unclassified Streptomyces TaxID=2593676 RepID=UPI003414DDF4
MIRGAAGEPTVLVVSAADDVTADLVIQKLNARAVPVVRLDPGDFPSTVNVNAALDVGGLGGSMRTATRTVDLGRVRSVYWRRPSAYSAPEGMSEQDARWCLDQARYGLGGILGALPGAHYVNHPWRNRDAEYKPAQLATAARCGLAVPPTLITNDTERARQFAKKHGPVVYKPVRNTDYRGAGTRALTVWVDEVSPSDIGLGVARTIHLFQKRVDKTADVRLTAVDRRLFAVRIDGAPGLDWRRDYDALSYTLIETPPEVADGVRAYLDAFRLVFGAFDFGLDHQGRWWVYECNPNGQWAWFPDPVTEQIATALADQLQYSGKRHDY